MAAKVIIPTFLLAVNTCTIYAPADLVLECRPVGGAYIEAGAQVDIECLVTFDVARTSDSSQIDMACALQPQLNAVGSITIAGFTANPDGLLGFGPSSEGFPYLWGDASTALYFPEECHVVGFRGVFVPVNVPAGFIGYLGTFRYEVSECAAGDFDVMLENFSSPPDRSDKTSFGGIENHDSVLFPFVVVPTTVTVLTGSCCLPDRSCTDLGTACCEAQGGIPGELGSDCASSFDTDGDGWPNACDPCPIDADNDSDGDGICDSADLCPGEDDTIDANNDQVPDCLQKIPTVSAWGLVVLALCLSIATKSAFGRRNGFTPNKR